MIEPVYIDTSCLLKLLIPEPATESVRDAVAVERDIVVSTLAQVEARTRLLALRRGGAMTNRQYLGVIKALDDWMKLSPFRTESLAGNIFETAIGMLKKRGATPCRSLDRLHIAAMVTLELRRLLTADERQAKAAEDEGFAVTFIAER